MQHIQEEHHKISIKTAKKLFEELWDKNEQLNDPDFTEINTRESGGKYGETPHYKNAEKVNQKYAKNARTMATNDITSMLTLFLTQYQLFHSKHQNIHQ